ncbi:L,D-transpeptidase family protein [Paracoccus endophyticus]|uniref:L,D-transpeptidase family protein n=1 Tax=Paracoccus endophyticus TaxID=2233774 RepID=UPI001F0C3381|nr:L,D-transpeptidase [Paracoccus endophyticus]
MPRAPLMLTAAPLALAVALAVAAAPARAQSARAIITAADIEAATFSGVGELPPGQSALTARVQVLLDRAGVSPGVVDGFRGGMSESALSAFERKSGLPVDGRLDPQVWALLQPFAAAPLTADYTITDADAQGLVEAIPTDYAKKAEMESMGYTSVAERLAETFHMDEKFILQLNPGVALEPGATIKVTVPAKPIRTKVARIIVDKEAGRVAAYDAAGRMVVDYPATVGSSDNPSPHGTHTVTAVAKNPDYTYNPNTNFKQGDNDKVLRVPPGPNGPVGNMWIDLSEPTYGIHGTPTPSRLFVSESHGCVRLTNWDATELAGMVTLDQTVVEFLAPGVRIADVTPAVPPAVVPVAAPVAAPVAGGLSAPGTGDGIVAGAPAALSVAAGKPLPRPAGLGGATAPLPPLAVPVAVAADGMTAGGVAPAGVVAGAAPMGGPAAGPAAGAMTPALDAAAVAAGVPAPAADDSLSQALSTASGGMLQAAPAMPAVPPQDVPAAGTVPAPAAGPGT